MTNRPPEGIIHGAPGMPVPEYKAPTESHEPIIADPTRVPGHPSNPWNGVGAAYGEYLKAGASSDEVGGTTLSALGVEEPQKVDGLITPEDIPKS